VPLFYQHYINEDTRLGIWSIEEQEAFFLRKVPLQREVSHPQKRLQHLAGRYLLQYLFPGFPYELIKIADTRKPYLSNEAYHFSISHCGNYAAALVSKSNRVGIDIEIVRPVIENIKRKFLSEGEMSILREGESLLHHSIQAGTITGPNIESLTICWSAKEAMFKWFGEGGVDFRQHMLINAVARKWDEGIIHCTFSKLKQTSLVVPFNVMDNLVLAWVIT
jgi:phosphopantetheinyl transferase